jgi:hypothetical protein
MKDFITITLLFASATSNLAISRQIHGYRVHRVWPYWIAALFAAIMTTWFLFAAIWEYWNG